MKKYLAIALALGYASSAGANVLNNGGFETGDFTGWTQVTSTQVTSTSSSTYDCAKDWTVSDEDDFCQAAHTVLNDPIEGTYAAFNSFDGLTNSYYIIKQDINLANFVQPQTTLKNANLSWLLSYGYDFVNDAVEQRVFSLAFLDRMNAVIGTAYELIVDPLSQSAEFVDWTSDSADVTSILQAYMDQTVTLQAKVYIAERFAGAGTLGLDDVNLELEFEPIHNPPIVPLPASSLLLLGGMGALGAFRRRKRA